MPRSNKKPKVTPDNAFDKYEFINYRLTSEHREACVKWVESADINGLQALSELAADGYKLSVSHSEKLNATIATMTNNNGPKDFQGKILSIRARDGYEAIMRLFWLHYVMADSDWANITQDMSDDIW